tara:strand:- start:335 stop:763 length:429 start_codon:yes stop_codon:yes gene_type:complete
MNEIKHFKLSNGDEIVCDVIEWPDVDGDSPDVVVRNVFKIVVAGTKGNGIRYYQFRPWMVYQDEPGMFQVINCNHIIGEANPPNQLIEQYWKIIEADEVTDEDIQKKLSEYIDNLKDSLTGDSDQPHMDSKILKFPGKSRLH